jgi:hypothetical protein
MLRLGILGSFEKGMGDKRDGNRNVRVQDVYGVVVGVMVCSSDICGCGYMT